MDSIAGSSPVRVIDPFVWLVSLSPGSLYSRKQSLAKNDVNKITNAGGMSAILCVLVFGSNLKRNLHGTSIQASGQISQCSFFIACVLQREEFLRILGIEHCTYQCKPSFD